MSITRELLYEEFFRNNQLVSFLKRNRLSLNIVDSRNFMQYKDYLGNINICNPDFIKETYELLSYAMLQDEGNIGIFLTKHENSSFDIVVSLIINTEPDVDMKEMLSRDTVKETLIEVILLCSNWKKRVYYAAKQILQVLQAVFELHNKNMILKVAKGIDNENALMFYKELGFYPIKNMKSTLLWTPSHYTQYGGRIMMVHKGLRGGKYIQLKNRRVYV